MAAVDGKPARRQHAHDAVMSRPVSRRHAAALLLILATIVFVIGISAEPSLGGEATAERLAESADAISAERSEEAAESPSNEEAASEAEETGAPHDEAAEASEAIFGINPESTGAIAAAVVISLLLAAALWFWGTPGVLIVAALFALLFAALDLRELMNQLSQSRTSLVVIALAAALLHGGVALLAGLSLTQRSSSTV